MKKALVLLAAMLLAPGALAQSADWQKTWDQTLAAAKKEGKVVVAGSPDPVMRDSIIPAFEKRYSGIKVEFLAGRSSDITQRVITERGSGIYSVDVYMSGPDTTYNVLYPQKLIDPLRPQLILPEVTDGKKWKSGKLWFMDKEGQYSLRLFSGVDSWLFINTDYVKPEEMKSADDLVNPKWKGKITTEDPARDRGAGGNTSALIYAEKGPEYTKKLYVDQAPIVSADRRQMSDWLARGTYPICLTCRADDVSTLQKEGFKILEVYDLAGLKSRINASPFLLTLANKAPNPNAARVFVNWMASKEGVELYARGFGSVPLRTDIDESFLDPRSIPKSGVEYFDDSDPQWRSVDKVPAGEKVRALLKGQ